MLTHGVLLNLDSLALPAEYWLTASEWQWLQNALPKRQQTFAWGRAALRWLCCKVAGADCNEVLISLPSGRGPEIWINNTQWHCSVSHSQSKLVVLLNQSHRIAVDIECCRPNREIAKYKSLFPLLEPYCTSTSVFYQRWTCLETLAKYHSIPLIELLTGDVCTPATEVHHFKVDEYLVCCAPANIPVHWYFMGNFGEVDDFSDSQNTIP